MAAIYLHIGTPKTGTSSIQVALADNNRELNKQGITFPDLGYRYEGIRDQRNGHFLIDVHDESGEDYIGAVKQLKELITQYEKIILTDESLWNNDRRIPKFVADMKEAGAEVKIVVYFRRQDLYLQSQWAQDVKETMTWDFDYFLETTKIRVDFYKQACVLAELVGKENLLVRVYERSQFINNDLVTDFFETVGIVRTEEFVEEKTANPSLSGIYLEAKRLLNRTEAYANKTSFVVPYLLRIAEKNGEKASFSKNIYFSSRKQKEFLRKCEESNQMLAKEFLGREDGVLFKDMIELNEEPVQETGVSESYAKLAAFIKENNLEKEACRYVEKMNQDTYDARYKKEECVDVLAEVILMQKECIDGQKQKIKAQKERIAKLLTPKESVKSILRYGRDQVKGAFMSGKKKEK